MFKTTQLSDFVNNLVFQKYKNTNNKHNFQKWICCRTQVKDEETELFPTTGQRELVQLTQYIQLR
jgi:hypothetical protein